MNAVIGYTDLMLLEDRDDSGSDAGSGLSEINRDYLTTIRKSGRLLLTIINDILDVSKIEAGELNLDSKPFSLQKALKTVYDNIRSFQKTKGTQGVVLEFHAIDSLDNNIGNDAINDCVVGDPARLQQVLHNLLSNAIKFTESGRVKCELELTCVPSGENGNDATEMLQFCVEDTGLGIPNEKLVDIVKPFNQVHPTRDTHELGGEF